MNTTNIPMASWNSMGISSGTAGSMQQSSVGGASLDGSIFQQLIAKVTAMSSQGSGATQGNLLQPESGGTSVENGSLMELLFAGENSSGLEFFQTEGQSEAKEENGALEILQALMSGLPAAAVIPANSAGTESTVSIGSTMTTDSTAGTQTAALSLPNGNEHLLSANIPANQETVLGSPALAQGQGFVFRSGALYTPNAEEGAIGNGTSQSEQSIEGVTDTAGELAGVMQDAGKTKAGRNGFSVISNDALPVEGSSQTQSLGDGGKTAAMDLSALKQELQQNGGLRFGAAASLDDPVNNQNAGEGKIAQADEQKHDGAATPAQEYLNTVHYIDPVKESGMLSQSAQTAGKTEQYSQIGDEILSRLEQKNTNEFRMQLQPEDLGQIDIKLKLNEGRLIIDIMAASAKTQALLTNQVDKLIASMGLQNVQVESVQVSQQMNQQSNGGQNQWQSMNFGMDFSQQRNQEQLHKQTHHEGSLTGSGRTSQIEVQETVPIKMQNLRQYSLHRLNYTV